MAIDPYRFVPDNLWVGTPISFETEEGGVLSLAPSQFVPYSFSFGIRTMGDEIDTLNSLVRLADDEGRVWEGESIWDVSEIVHLMTHFGSPSPPVPFEYASADWQQALESNTFLSGARGLLDDRFYRQLCLMDRIYQVPFKYQGPVVALAYLQYEAVDLITVLARVANLFALDSKKSGDQIDLPDIVYEIDVFRRLFVNYGYEEPEGFWEYDVVPRPLVFKKTVNTAPAQPLVNYRRAG